jgi:chromosome segregation ATPase
MNATIAKFLGALKGARNGRRTSAHATYWAAAAALADGHEPSSKPAALAECLERIGKTEDDLAADAQRLAMLAQVERIASREPDARARLRAAAIAKGDAEKRAAEFEKRARDLRAEVEAATAEAANELDAARKAVQRAADLRLELARLGHPDYADEVERRERALAVDGIETQLRGLATELAEARAAVEALPVVDADRFAADRAARVRGRLELLTEKHARLVARLESLRNGAPIDAEGDSDDDAEDLERAEDGEAVTP